LHLKHYALSIRHIDCETDTLAECLRRIGATASESAPGKWIMGHGWNQKVWGAWPTAADLDVAAANNPVFLTAKSCMPPGPTPRCFGGPHVGTADPR
jgi:predicted amidohydrolase YtcJ